MSLRKLQEQFAAVNAEKNALLDYIEENMAEEGEKLRESMSGNKEMRSPMKSDSSEIKQLLDQISELKQ